VEASVDPPDAERLAALPPDDWAVLLGAAREILNDLDRPEPHLRRLRAVPDGRLRSGRSRRELCAAIASDREMWRAIVERLAATGQDAGLLLTAAVEPGRANAGDLGDEVERLRRESADLRAREERHRARIRELVAERDDARRRAEGLAARLETERRRTSREETRRADVERERDELRQRLAAAEDERRTHEERLRRRHQSELAERDGELRRLRREIEDRERARVRDERSRREIERRAREEIASYRGGRGGEGHAAEPGRPHRLPPGVTPGSERAFDAVLAAGPRLLIDGYNVTKQHRSAAPLDQQRRWLTGLAQGLAARTPVVPTVVFDGEEAVGPTANPAVGRRVRTVFSRGRDADDEIVAIVSGLPADAPVAVVTDDRELAGRVAGLGADVFGTDVFVATAG
jgi:hypothetical protein